MREVEIPAYVNNQPSFFMWELDEFILMIGLILVGYIMRGLWLPGFIALGLWSASKLKKWKRRELDGVIPHVLYMKGFTSLNKIYKNAYHGSLWI
jgi:type IV conjugative transfer system protein TraL